MKLAIIGSRGFCDEGVLNETLYRHFSIEGQWLMDEIVSGGATGADKLGAAWAKEHNIKLTEFIPDWAKYGKRAGFIRNEDIVKAADMVLAFWDGASKGTANSLAIAKRLKKPTMIIYF
jgi:hypothetical protein